MSFEALRHKAIPVLRGSNADVVLAVARRLIAEGFTTLEVTFTVPDAAQVVTELSLDKNVTVGAGTLLNAANLEAAVAAGARFLVSPGLTPALADAAREVNIPFLPGALTPSEVMVALEAGFDHLKLFPGELGGAAHLKSLRAPFPAVSLMPTGGVSADNLAEWVAAGAFAVGIGSSLIGDGSEAGIKSRARALRVALEAVGWSS